MNKSIAFIDLAAQQKRLHSKITNRINTVLSHGQYIMGPEVSELEKELEIYTGAKHAVTCGSGSDALVLALMSYNIGLKLYYLYNYHLYNLFFVLLY